MKNRNNLSLILQRVIVSACMLPMLLMGACVNSIADDDDSGISPEESRTITFKVKDYEIGFANTRAGLGDIIDYLTFTLFSADGKTKIKEIQQSKGDDDFGTMKCELVLDQYKLVVMGTKKSYPIINSSTAIEYENGKVNDTFYYYQLLDLTKDAGSVVNLKLTRPIAGFRLRAKGAIPDNMSTMEFAFSGNVGNVLNAETGYTAEAKNFNITINVVTDAIGKANQAFTGYLFLKNPEEEINVTATAKDKNGGVLYTHTLSGIPMKRSSLTECTGAFFEGENQISVSIENGTNWNDTIRYNF